MMRSVILKLYWRTDGLPISGVFCLQGKVSFLHLLHNLLKTEHLLTLQDRKVQTKYLAETMLTPEVVGELLLIVEILRTVDRADKRLISV